jgi:hypothetical protein
MKRLLQGFIILTVLVQLVAFTGCSSYKSSSNGTAQHNDVNQGLTEAPNNGNNQAINKAGTTSSTAASQASTAAQASDSRKIIMSASISLQTTGYDKSVMDLETLVTQYGGFVQDSSTEGTGKSDSSRTASYVVRIPSSKLDDFLNSVGGIGKVISKSKKGQDVTQDYFDTDARLTTLKAEEARILDILKKTTNMTDVITVEQRLTDVEDQIEQLTGELQKWDSLVDLSTVNINISEVKVITSTPDNFGSRIASVFSSSLNALVVTLKYILIVIIAVLPFAVVIGVILVVVYLILRRRKKYKKSVAPPPDKDPEE